MNARDQRDLERRLMPDERDVLARLASELGLGTAWGAVPGLRAVIESLVIVRGERPGRIGVRAGTHRQRLREWRQASGILSGNDVTVGALATDQEERDG